MQYGLTQRESDLLNFIDFYLKGTEGQIGPTFREMQVALELKNISSVSALVNSLEEKRWIARLPGKTRSIRLMGQEPRRHCGKYE